MDGQRFKIAVKRVLAVLKAHAHGDLFHALLELLGGQIACPFVQHAGDEVGETFFAGRILRIAAGERELERQNRHAVFFDEPGFDAAWTFDRFDFHGMSRANESDTKKQGGDGHRQRHVETEIVADVCTKIMKLDRAHGLTS